MWKLSNWIIQRSTNRFNYIADLKFWVRGAIKMQWNKPQWYWIWANIPSSKVEVLFNAKPHLTCMGSKLFWKTKICSFWYFDCALNTILSRLQIHRYKKLKNKWCYRKCWLNWITFPRFIIVIITPYPCTLRRATELWRWRAIRRPKKKCKETL